MYFFLLIKSSALKIIFSVISLTDLCREEDDGTIASHLAQSCLQILFLFLTNGTMIPGNTFEETAVFLHLRLHFSCTCCLLNYFVVLKDLNKISCTECTFFGHLCMVVW